MRNQLNGFFLIPLFTLISGAVGAGAYAYVRSRWSETYEGQILEKVKERTGGRIYASNLSDSEIVGIIAEYARLVKNKMIPSGYSDATLRKAAKYIAPKFFKNDLSNGQTKVYFVLDTVGKYIWPSDKNIYPYLRGVQTVEQREEERMEENWKNSLFGKLTGTLKAIAVVGGVFIIYRLTSKKGG